MNKHDIFFKKISFFINKLYLFNKKCIADGYKTFSNWTLNLNQMLYIIIFDVCKYIKTIFYNKYLVI